MIKHTLFLGLNDKDTKCQEINTIDAYKIALRTVCGVGYEATSISEITGFYTHKDGTVTTEKTLRIEIMQAEAQRTQALIIQLKRLFNQESVAIQRETIDCEFV